MSKTKTAIIGSGNIGTDLMIKIAESSDVLEVGCVIGIDPQSEGLSMARDRGFATSHDGVEGAPISMNSHVRRLKVLKILVGPKSWTRGKFWLNLVAVEWWAGKRT